MSHICIPGHGVHCTKGRVQSVRDHSNVGGHAPACHYLLFCSPAVAPNIHSPKIHSHTHVYPSLYKYTLESCGIHAATQHHTWLGITKKITLQIISKHSHTGQTTSGTPCTDSRAARNHITILLPSWKHTSNAQERLTFEIIFSNDPFACKVDIKELTFAIIDNFAQNFHKY